MTTENLPAKSPIDKLKNVMASKSVQEQFQNALAENSSLFVASLIDLYGSDTYLQKCNPQAVVMEALKAATLKLPVNKGLGFAWIVPYKDKQGNFIPTFQIGYRGYIQLAMRTGAYKYINADVVYEGENKGGDKLTGHLDLSGERTSDKVVGYFCHFETLNGFKKTAFMTAGDMEKHAKKYSKSYNSSSSPWKTDGEAMGIKTMLRNTLGKYGVLSVEMLSALTNDNDERTTEGRLGDALDNEANQGNIIDVEPEKSAEGKTGPNF